MRHDIIEYVEISSVIGRTVTVTVDRPLGSYHPEHKDMYYPINYGYVEGIMAPDGEEQDAYILGVDEAIEKFTGKISLLFIGMMMWKRNGLLHRKVWHLPRKKSVSRFIFRNSILIVRL